MSLADILCPGFPAATGCGVPKRAGDLVAICVNAGPRWRIIAVAAGDAWLRPIQGGEDAIVALERLRRVEA